jgi:hypothetical protein
MPSRRPVREYKIIRYYYYYYKAYLKPHEFEASLDSTDTILDGFEFGARG